MTNEGLTAILDLLHDRQFAYLRLLSSKRPLPYREFKTHPMPEGYDVATTWRLLSAIRRQTAAILPWKGYQERVDELWYSISESMNENFSEIEAKCRSDSSLARIIEDHPSKSFLIRTIAEEFVTALLRDGVHIDEDEAIDVMLGNRPPRAPNERALLNAFLIWRDIDTYRTRNIGHSVVWEMFERISQGIEQCRPKPIERNLDIVQTELSDSDVALAKIISMANLKESEGRINHPLFLAFSISSIIWDLHPLPAWNSLVELLLRSVLLMKKNLPVMCYIPMGKVTYEWESGRIGPPTAAAPWAEMEPECGEGMDVTAQFSSFLQLIVLELHRIEASIRKIRGNEESLCWALRDNPRINDRQRDVLELSIRIPEYRHSLQDHQKSLSIAYSTAREDFLGLVNLGLLRMEKQSKAYYYYAQPDMKSIILRQALQNEEGLALY